MLHVLKHYIQMVQDSIGFQQRVPLELHPPSLWCIQGELHICTEGMNRRNCA